MADKTVSWGIRISVDSDAKKGEDEIAALQKTLEQSQERIKQFSSALRNLKGDSDAVAEAKKKLKAQLASEKDAVSQVTLKLLEKNASLKRVKSTTEESTSILKRFGLENLSVATALGAVTVAVVALSAAIGAGAIAFGGWLIQQANALRTMGLFREAALGSAENARAMGNQIALLGSKVPQSAAELNNLSVEMGRALVGTRVSGQGIVDTFNAVAQASAAMGDSAGAKIQSIVDRSKQFGRMGLGLFELQGTGVDFTEVASSLSKNLGIGLAAAQNQLRMGRVNVNDGAKALRDAVEQKFSGINARRLLDLNVMAQKFKDTLTRLTRDINLEPLLGVVQRFFKLFDEGTVTGQALHTLFTDFGNTITKAFQAAGPFAEKFFKAMVLAGLHLELVFLRVAVAIKEKFGVNIATAFTDTSSAADKFGNALTGVAGIVDRLGDGLVKVVGGVGEIYSAIKLFEERFGSTFDRLKGMSWADLGRHIVTGIGKGMLDSIPGVKVITTSLSDAVKDRFKAALGIHSPSTVFQEYGRQTSEGYALGVKESKAPQQAVGGMVSPPRGLGGGGVSLNGGIHIHMHGVDGGKGGAQLAQSVAANIKAQLMKAVEEALIGMGGRPQGNG